MNFKKLQILACGLAAFAFVACGDKNNDNNADTIVAEDTIDENVDVNAADGTVTAAEILTQEEVAQLIEEAKNGNAEAASRLERWHASLSNLTEEEAATFENALKSYKELVETEAYTTLLEGIGSYEEIVNAGSEFIEAAGAQVSQQALDEVNDHINKAKDEINDKLGDFGF